MCAGAAPVAHAKLAVYRAVLCVLMGPVAVPVAVAAALLAAPVVGWKRVLKPAARRLYLEVAVRTAASLSSYCYHR